MQLRGQMLAQRFTSFRDTLKGLGVRGHALESPRCKCLSKYISELHAKSFVVEEEYTDSGYLVDYSNYYARSHGDLEKLTNRIHFFSIESKELSALWSKSTHRATRHDLIDRKIAKAYLGFVVIKPLPLTIVGRTCLKTYPRRDRGKRRTRIFPILRRYGVMLHGLRLNVDSIAFQEQDAEVAACATTAIWYALHGLTKKFTTQEIPSPFEITNTGSANMQEPAIGTIARKFPTNGLSLPQIDSYIRRCGLESIVFSLHPTDDASALLDYTAAFVRGGSPILLLGSLHASDHREDGYDRLGYHAMTILGFSVADGFQPGPWASRIARLFAHDDNVGPFSSFQIERLSMDKHEGLLGSDARNIVKTKPPNGNGKSISTLQEQTPKGTIHLLNQSGLQRVGGEVYRIISSYP
jgi:hypothetical protein